MRIPRVKPDRIEFETNGAGVVPDDESLAIERRLAWILGSPRTGSTWLLRMLVHPLELSRAPTGLRSVRGSTPPRGRAIVPINESHFPNHLTPLKEIQYRPEGGAPDPSAFLKNTERRDDPAYCFSEIYADIWRPHARAMILARFQAQAERAVAEHGLDADPLIVIKEPNGSHGAVPLMELLPRARLVFLIRDGRDVVDSQLALRLTGVRGSKSTGRYERQRGKWMRRNAWLWVNRMNAVQVAYEAHPPELRFRLRYEDLRAEPYEHLRRLTDFLGLERDDAQLRSAVDAEAFEALPDSQKGEGRGKRAARPGLWQERFSDAEKLELAIVMNDKLAELGYET